MHFFNKHSDNLVKAGRQLVKSHLEFGSAMADYPSLRQRYSRLRPLEEEQEALRRQGQGARLAKNVREVPRVRFVNYYTASTGRPKKLKSRSRSRQSDGAGSKAAATDGQSLNLPDPSTIASAASSRSPSLSPRISLEEHRDDGIVQKDPDVPQTPLSPVPDGDESEASLETDDHHSSGNGVELPKLPEIPPLPEEPDPIDLTQFTDRNARKIMERQHARAVKAYKQAERDRNRALKDRSKLEALYRKKANAKSEVGERPKHETEGEDGVVSTTSTSIHDTSKHGPAEAQNDQTTKGTEEEDILKRYRDAETAAMAAHRQKMPTSPPPVANEETQSLVAPSESGTALTATSTVDSDTRGRSTQAGKGEVKKKKDKKFCMLPAKGPDGSRDPTWVRVYMKDVDEVGAHCGLFVLSDTYEMLVGEVSGKIEEWARDDMSRRYIGAAH